MFRRAAIYVDNIFAGIKPAGLAVEQPTKFELIVNIKTAKALGLTIPQSLMLQAGPHNSVTRGFARRGTLNSKYWV